MTEAQRIADQHRRAHEGEAWHGPPIQDLLAVVDAPGAAVRSIPDAHTIWEIVLHITAWNDAARRRVEGDPAELTDKEDWPDVGDTRGAAWDDAVATLRTTGQALRDAIGELADGELQATVVGADYSLYALLHGVVQHDLYHAGQIAFLRKLSDAA